MKQSTSFPRLKNDDVLNILDKYSISPSIKGQSFDRFGNNTFDFAFFGLRISLDFVLVDQPFEIASEVCRILRYGGLTTFRDVKGLYSTSSMYEVVLRKSLEDSISDDIAQRCDNNTVPEYKRDLIGDLEPLEEKEPLEDWTEQGKHSESIKLFRHLPTMVDLIYKRMYIYIDLGARTYNSMIGNWFEKLYPKQSKRFEIFTIEADKSFHEYKRKKDVTLLPYPAWIRNETLVFGTRNKKREYTGRIQPGQPQVLQDYMGEQNVVQAFDFADWLIRSFSRQDFVVLKIDVEGTEMDLIPRLVESGAICLTNEFVLGTSL
ncbi:uncharacterized protein [Coffea arabica]|uniref:DUF7870 domain-containing protein n=1 Tax=Coffea arabica TaxID=13443 RepID=A0ABM4UAJ3_COFAR